MRSDNSDPPFTLKPARKRRSLTPRPRGVFQALSIRVGVECEDLEHSLLDTPARPWSSDLKTGIMSKKLFGDLTFGTRFTFYGTTYIKIALNMAEDENRNGNIFQAETQVELIECDHEPEKPETS